MDVSELLDLFRVELDDDAKPYLWSDKEFFTYLNEAQDLFVRLIGGIADRRSAITKITYRTGDQFKKFDERIYRIKGAFDEENRILTLRNLDNFEGAYADDDYGIQFMGGLDDGRTGDIKYLVTDVETNEIQLYPIPDHDGWIRLFVYRRPLELITDKESEIEIPAHHRICLLEWVKYKALLKQDVETFEGTKALDFRNSFIEYVNQAKREKLSREDTKRIVTYGGIPMS